MVKNHHLGHLQVFVTRHIVLAHQRQRCLVVKVLPLAAHPLICFRQQCNRIAPAIAAFLAA
jgi:hypothetical protein